MRHLFSSAIALAILASAPAAYACQYTQGREPVGQASGQYFANEMVAEAAYVDLVLVEDDGVRAMGEQPSNVLTLRTIARLKGNSADRIAVFGQGMTVNREAERIFNAELQHFTSETGQVTPFPYNQEWVSRLLPAARTDPPPPPLQMTSCSPPSISAQTGRFYVVMRNSSGRVLDRIAMSNGTQTRPNHPAFGFVPVKLEEDDFWLYSVRLAALREANPSGLAVLHLRPGSDGIAVERTLRSAGATIRAAFYDHGGFIEEVRPSPEEQTRPWLAKAGAYLAGSSRGRIGDPFHGGAEYLRQHLSPMQQYGTGLGYEVAQAFTASVRQSGEAMSEPRLIAVEVEGDAQSFAGQSFVARVAPLEVTLNGLPQVAGQSESEVFATSQRIDRDIWLMNGGGGNRQGTLP
ncbi:hypothetical protein [Pontixanthobacter sp.]|uniref:hypothetical protein n=1 Tax=Pontixanthobacter sp. TaxID=2792078 RepID=UPI003C79E06F